MVFGLDYPQRGRAPCGVAHVVGVRFEAFVLYPIGVTARDFGVRIRQINPLSAERLGGR